MSRCPKCSKENVHRSRTRNWWERWRKEITGKRPYRCSSCNWRGWMVIDPSEFDRATRRSMAPDPPNLKGTLLARADPIQRIDLKELDRFHGAAGKGDE